MICANARDESGPTLNRLGGRWLTHSNVSCPSSGSNHVSPDDYISSLVLPLPSCSFLTSFLFHTMAISSNPAMQVYPGRGLGFLGRYFFVHAFALLISFSLRSFLARCLNATQSSSTALSYHRSHLLALQASCCPCHPTSTSEWHSSTFRWT